MHYPFSKREWMSKKNQLWRSKAQVDGTQVRCEVWRQYGDIATFQLGFVLHTASRKFHHLTTHFEIVH